MHARGELKRRRQTSGPAVRRLVSLLPAFMQRNEAQSLQIMLECAWSSHMSALSVLDWQIKATGEVFKRERSIKEETFLPADSSLSSAVDGGF